MFRNWRGRPSWIGVHQAIHMPRVGRPSPAIQPVRTCTDGSDSASGRARSSSVDWFVMTPPRAWAHSRDRSESCCGSSRFGDDSGTPADVGTFRPPRASASQAIVGRCDHHEPLPLPSTAVQVTIVGWAGSFPGPASPASCYLIDTGDFRLVLDLGNGALGALQLYSRLDQIDAICLSHLHADHCLDMCGYSVAQTYHPDGPRPPIPAYGPAGAAARPHLAPGREHLALPRSARFPPMTPRPLPTR